MDAVMLKKDPYRGMLACGTPDAVDGYWQAKQAAAARVVLEAKTQVWEEFDEAMEEDHRSASKKFWKPSGASGGKQCSANTVYSAGGELLTSTGDIVGQWKEYLRISSIPPTTRLPLRKQEAEFQACPSQDAPGGDPGHAGETMSLGWPGNASESPREELEEVSGVREVWASLCSDCCLCDPVPDKRRKMDEDRWQITLTPHLEPPPYRGGGVCVPKCPNDPRSYAVVRDCITPLVGSPMANRS
ncbi:hypothetical protein L3Q82_018657 [Scortum barcoo]|uniref:Uncharacterized protein n=1 Tax=Scortum barcoo TaxID=214431 RepID=A0ACB8VF13_9TELE|nr:hypothetical protein L3Q82_018657 [Scortum barcoo]